MSSKSKSCSSLKKTIEGKEGFCSTVRYAKCNGCSIYQLANTLPAYWASLWSPLENWLWWNLFLGLKKSAYDRSQAAFSDDKTLLFNEMAKEGWLIEKYWLFHFFQECWAPKLMKILRWIWILQVKITLSKEISVHNAVQFYNSEARLCMFCPICDCLGDNHTNNFLPSCLKDLPSCICISFSSINYSYKT